MRMEPKENASNRMSTSAAIISSALTRERIKPKRKREMVFLPPRTMSEPEEPKTPPGLPPKIIGQAERAVA